MKKRIIKKMLSFSLVLVLFSGMFMPFTVKADEFEPSAAAVTTEKIGSTEEALPVNLALQGKYSSDGNYNDGSLNLKPDYAFDGKVTNVGYERFASPKGQNHYLQIDFKKEVTFNRLKIYETPSEMEMTGVKLFTSTSGTDDSFQEVNNIELGKNSPAMKDINLTDNVTTQYLRIMFTGSIPGKDRGYNIDELEIYYEPMVLQISELTGNSVMLKWNAVFDAEGYNVYQNGEKINQTPVTEQEMAIADLGYSTEYVFRVAAVKGGEEFWAKEVQVKTKSDPAKTLPSGDGKDLKMEYSDLALGIEYVGPALSDPNYYYWCISPIEDQGKTHLFASRWPKDKGMGGWMTDCEFVHFVGDQPEGPFTQVGEVVLGNGNLPAGQHSPHNIRVKKIDNKFVMVYIVQTLNNNARGQKIGMMTADSLDGPWEFAGQDGIVVKPEDSGWTKDSVVGTDNHDIIKIDDKYYIYFKAGTTQRNGAMQYGYAVADNLTGPYRISDEPMTDSLDYLEDACCFEMNGKYYLLSCDNYGTNTGVFGYGILWESETGTGYKRADAKIGFGLLSDYTQIPANATYPYGDSNKFERPAVLMRDGKPAYFYAANGTNVEGNSGTENYVFKVNIAETAPEPKPEPKPQTDLPGKVTNVMVSAQDTGSITLRWDPELKADQYQVMIYNSESRQWEELARTTETAYMHSGLEAGTIYQYMIKAINRDGEGLGSDPLETATVPEAARITVSSGGGNQAKINWEKIKASQIEIYMSTDGGEFQKIGEVTGEQESYTVKDLGEKEYQFQIRGYVAVEPHVYGTFSNAATYKKDSTKKATNKAAKTGDTTQCWPYIMLSVAALVGTGSIVLKRR